MANPEIQQNTNSTLSGAPSDTLLKNFSATLDKRWDEFDKATLEEAGIFGKVGRDSNSDYTKAKSAFDNAKSILSNTQSDTQLKNNPEVLSTVENTLKDITDYLRAVKPEEKTKAMNVILSRTSADLTEFKAEITGNIEDKKSAEVAKNSANEVAAAVVAAPIAVAALSPTSILDEAKGEITTEIKKELGPWAMMFKGVKGVPTKEVAEQVKNLSKEYSEKKWTSDPFDKLFSMIQLFFIKMQVSRAGMDLSGDMTPEEMKLAGIKGLPSKEEEKKGEEKDKKPSDKYTGSRYIFQGLFLNEKNLPITDILDTMNFKNSTIQELNQVHTSKGYKQYLSKIGKTPNDSNIQALAKILEVTFTGKSSTYILEAYNSTNQLPKNSKLPVNITFGAYIIAASTVLKSMSGLAKAAATQQMQNPNMSQNPDGSIKFNDNEEEEYASLIDGDKKLLGFMLGTNSTSKYTIGKRDEFNADLIGKAQFNNLYPTPEEKNKATATINKILDFSDTFMKTIQSNQDINLGMGNELGQVINGKAFNLKGLMLIYLSMQGKNIENFSEFSTIEQAKVYTIVTTIFNYSGDSIDNGKNTANYLDALNNTTSPIPSGVKDFMADSTMYIADKAATGFLESIKYMAGMASAHPKLALGFAAMNIPFVPARDSVADLLF